MSRPLIVKPLPVPAAPDALVAVDRVVTELRRGGSVALLDPDHGAALVMAAEAASPETLDRFAQTAGLPPQLALTGRRAAVLGLAAAGPVMVLTGAALTAAAIARLCDPLQSGPLPPVVPTTPSTRHAEGAVALTKLARLLPAAVIAVGAPVPDWAFRVGVADVLGYSAAAAHSLRRVAEARVPLADAEDARIVAFRPSDGGIEHLAIVIAQPDRDAPVLTRLHSECFTGDLLGSLRCDCGDQLRGAIAEIARAGGGVLLYLAQEGRGIGLVNKLRAYELQDQGFDTLDANRQLGFDDDERIYLPAAEMLRRLGIDAVRLLTNNPAKVEGLTRHGVTVAERVPHVFPSNGHNEQYLHTKATRGGHLF